MTFVAVTWELLIINRKPFFSNNSCQHNLYMLMLTIFRKSKNYVFHLELMFQNR